jgi:hypothetical protein
MKRLAAALAPLLAFFFGFVVPAIAQTNAKGFIGLALSDVPRTHGATVAMVKPGAPADQAGIRPGDLIVSINGEDVDRATTVTNLINAIAPKQIAHIAVVRGRGSKAEHLTIDVVVGTADSAFQATTGAAPPAMQGDREPPAAVGNATAGSSSAGPVGYTTISDPIEQAFTVEVPTGWLAAAGMARRSTLQINPYVRALSPDKMTYLLLGEPTLPGFVPPSLMLNKIGLREGMISNSGHGGASLIWRYVPGAEYARTYAETMLKGLCPDLTFMGSQDRPDLAQVASTLFPLPTPCRFDGGEARFRCTHNKQEMEVRVEAATRLTRNNVMWNVVLLRAFIAPTAQAGRAEEMLIHMGRSISFNPAWVQMQENLCRQADLSNTLALEDYFRKERKFIDKLNSVDENFSSMDEIISGYSSYYDAKTGNKYSLSNTNPNWWVDDSSGRLLSTSGTAPPGWGYSKLQHVP